MLETVEEQRAALNSPVEPRFICQNRHIKGPFTTGDYVRWKMNQIFGPDNWSHTILQGPALVKVNDLNAYVQVTIRLNVHFAGGQQITHDDVGVAVLQATRGSDLEGTMPERYETVLKAAITDGVKACAEYLGICFRPLGDEVLDQYIRGHKRRSSQSGRGDSEAPPRKLAEKEMPAAGTTGEASGAGPTEFWSRFTELERQGLITSDLRNAPEVKQARRDGDWSNLVAWLEAQAGQ
jgi:hypothetical protein